MSRFGSYNKLMYFKINLDKLPYIKIIIRKIMYVSKKCQFYLTVVKKYVAVPVILSTSKQKNLISKYEKKFRANISIIFLRVEIKSNINLTLDLT